MHESAGFGVAFNRSHSGPVAVEAGRPGDLDWVTGDRQAFERIYRQHVGRIYAICLRMTANVHRAEELTQESFVRAWEKRSSFRGDAELFGWLRRIAINAVLSDARTRARLSDLEDTAELAATNRDPTTPMDLERAIADLPSGARVVLVLHDIEGHTHGEIGGLLDISPTTSKTQLHRARRLLRKALV